MIIFLFGDVNQFPMDMKIKPFSLSNSRFFFSAVLLALLIISCNNDDPLELNTQTLPNQQYIITEFKPRYVIDGATDVSLQPTLSWEKAFIVEPRESGDNIPELSQNIEYELNINKKENWKEQIIILTTSTTHTLTETLEENTTYEWAVTANYIGEEEIEYFETIAFTFTTGFTLSNSSPSIVSLNTPEPNAVNIDPEFQEFDFSAGVDPEGDVVDYELNITGNGENGPLDIYVTSVIDEVTPADIANSGYSTLEFKSNEEYEWNVKARDGKGGLSESETRTFTTRNTGTIGISIPGKSQVISTDIRFGTEPTWGGVLDHEMIVHNGLLFDIGGNANENGAWREGNDVYSSSNGSNWTTVKGNTNFNSPPFEGFNPSDEHALVSHAGLLYVFDGNRNSIHTSALGQVWSLKLTEGSIVDGTYYTARRDHEAISYNNNLYLMGGISGGVPQSDVWVSNDDGTTWEKIKETDNSSWRAGEVQVVVAEDAMYLFETRTTSEQGPHRVWKSTDGANWEYLADAPWTADKEFKACSYLFGMAVVGGDENNEVWWSEDGMEWSRVTFPTPNEFDWRQKHFVLDFNGSILISYGQGLTQGDIRTDLVKIWFDP
ncbi:MAG: hypothetical protein AAGC47_05490 [Bacteroidota bacterium]